MLLEKHPKIPITLLEKRGGGFNPAAVEARVKRILAEIEVRWWLNLTITTWPQYHDLFIKSTHYVYLYNR